MTTSKKMTAAICAVMHYIRIAEEETPADALQPGAVSAWGLSGRQELMQMRTQMQMKALQGRKGRLR